MYKKKMMMMIRTVIMFAYTLEAAGCTYLSNGLGTRGPFLENPGKLSWKKSQLHKSVGRK